MSMTPHSDIELGSHNIFADLGLENADELYRFLVKRLHCHPKKRPSISSVPSAGGLATVLSFAFVRES